MRAEEERVRKLIRGIANVLHRFGYLQRGEPTAKADTLAGVFDNNGLIITEMLDQGVFATCARPMSPKSSPGSPSTASSGAPIATSCRST